MANTIAELLVSLGLDLADYKAGFADATKITDKIARDMDKMASRLAGVGTAMTAAITLPLVGAGTVGLSAFGDFESSLNRVSALGEITGANLDKLKAQALDLGAKTKFSAKEAADGMADLAAKGFDTVQILEAMPGVLALAASESMGVARASEIATSAMGQFNLATNDLNHIADVLAKGASASSASVTDLGESLKLAGPVANLAGLSIEQTTAYIAKLSDAGLKGSDAGSGLRGVLAALVNPSKDAAATLADLGVKTADAGGKMRPISEILDSMKTAGANAGQVLNVFGRESASAASALMNTGSPAIKQLTTDLVNSDGAAAKMAATMNKGLSGSIEQMKGSVETAGIALGQVLAPYAIAAANGLQSLADKMSGVFQWFQSLPTPVQNVALSIAAVAAAIGPLLLGAAGLTAGISAMVAGWGGLMAGCAAASTVLTAIGAVLATVTLPALATVAAIASVTAVLVALGVWVYDNWEPIRAVLVEAWNGITELWTAAWTPIQAALTSIWSAISDTAIAVWTPIQEFLSSIWTPVEAASYSVWNGVKAALESVWNAIRNMALPVWNAIVGALEGFLEIARKVPGVSKLLNLDDVWNSAKKAADALKDHSKATDDAATAHGELGKTISKQSVPAVNVITDKLSLATAAKKKAKEAAKQLSAEHKGLVLSWKLSATAAKEHTKEVKENTKQFEALLKTMPKLVPEWQAGITKMNEMTSVLGTLDLKISDTELKALSATAAMKSMGITPIAELENLATQAGINFGKIQASGISTPQEIDKAWVLMETARKAALIAAGTDLPAEEQRMLDTMIAKLGDHKEKQRTLWGDIHTDIRAGVHTLSSDLIHNLFTGEQSWGATVKGALGKVRDSFLETFETQITGVIDDFVSKGLKSLMGALDDVIEKLIGKAGVGKAMDTVFGKAVHSAGSGASSGSGVGGAAAGAAVSGVAGIVTAVASVATAISSIVGNFQMAAINKSLDLIEKSTRYTMLYVGEREDGGILGVLFRVLHEISFGTSVRAIEKARDVIEASRHHLENIDTHTAYVTPQLDTIGGFVSQIPDRLSALLLKPMVTYVTVTLDGREISANVTTRMTNDLSLQVA